jgi:hypothetical protein
VKNAICFLLVFWSASNSFGQPAQDIGSVRLTGGIFDPFEHGIVVNPYRRIGDSYYNLMPFYAVPYPNTNANLTPYSVDHALQSWTSHYCEVVEVLDDGLLVRPRSRNDMGDTFFLTNYPSHKHLVDNELISFMARASGNYRYTDTTGASRSVPFYDCGVAVSYEEIDKALHLSEKAAAKAAAESAQKAADDALRLKKRAEAQANAVKMYQTLAEKGDAYGQFRLGEFYRDGDGVAQDAAKAKELFTKSAAQGNQDAARALDKMNAANPK